ncbi:esterase [Flavivirga aquatica]|uniref:Esterase n=1 Tax=Flavivirga aquatica TaxID=1849968 RepID=A0A1E5TAG0_9FLAO|nr:esterase [Flavivirga aquatica]OEK08316.1 esterase [Flavivirga aquatica]
MKSQEKEILYTITNSYSTLNTLTETTKNVWFVCHGMGYLSRYFLKYFKGLDPKTNYIIAPQAASKYYINSNFRHVGASWLTKENTKIETENIMKYFDTVFQNENLPKTVNLIVFGYSQGVSVAMRYVSSRQIQCQQLILHSGGIPKELNVEDLAFYTGKAHLICGTKDKYITKERLTLEIDKAKKLFKTHLNTIIFDGMHEVNIKAINELA